MILFADDSVLFTTDPTSLQVQMNILYRYSDKWGLKINVKKLKYVFLKKKTRQNHPEEFYINHEKIEQVDSFHYLGVKFVYIIYTILKLNYICLTVR